MKTRNYVLAAAGLVAATGLALTLLREKPQSVAAKARTTPVVPVVEVTRQDLAQTITLTAELIPFQEVEVMSKVAGYVQKIYVDAGDHVRQGQTLAVLEVPEMKDDLTRTEASIQRYRADLTRARDEVERANSVYQMAHLTATRLASVMKTQPGLVAQQEVDDAQSRDLIAAAQVSAAKSALGSAEEQIKVAEADRSKAKTLIDYTRVVAPFDGVVTQRYANNGAMIQAGTASHSQAMPVVRISQNSLLRLVLPVPESAAGGVRPGTGVEIRVPSLNMSFSGKVARIADKVDTTTRTMPTEVDVPNPKGQLIPGMFAEVKLVLAESKATLSVPVTAVKEADGKKNVYVVDASQRIEMRQVVTGLESADAIEIRDGLREGDRVVTANQSRLTLGEQVEAKLTQKAGA